MLETLLQYFSSGVVSRSRRSSVKERCPFIFDAAPSAQEQCRVTPSPVQRAGAASLSLRHRSSGLDWCPAFP